MTARWTEGLIGAEDAARVRDALATAGFTADAVGEVLGEPATVAMRQREPVAALRATGGGSPLETLIRLFMVHVPVPTELVEQALPIAAAGPLLATDGDMMRSVIDLRSISKSPSGDKVNWLVASDLRNPDGSVEPDHVLGVGGASTSLAQVTVRDPVDTALDIGTGSGIQALHLNLHSAAVTATDTSARALRFAATTLALSGASAELLQGSMLEPVADRQFDQIVSNPPFVISPGRDFEFRDSGRRSDDLVRSLVRSLPDRLTPGGTAQLLANWLHTRGVDWRERIDEWFEGLPCDVWVLQREVTDPIAYVSSWLSDAKQSANREMYGGWLDMLDGLNAEAIGFGLITMRRVDRAGIRRYEHLRAPLQQAIGPEISSWLERQDYLRATTDEMLLHATFAVDPSVDLAQRARRGEDGWETTLIELHHGGPIGWTAGLDRPIAELVQRCDGSTPLEPIVMQVISGVRVEDIDPAIAEVISGVRVLVMRGFLRPVRSALPA